MNLESDDKTIRKLKEQEAIPYDLLLLADEAKEIVDTYVPQSEIYVLEKNNQIIAVYVLQVIDQKRVEIKNIAVQQNYQGQGIGKHLLKDATRRAKNKGFEILLIGTANASIKQLYLYQKEGFEITSIKKNFFIDHYPEVIFENGIQCKHMIMLEKPL